MKLLDGKEPVGWTKGLAGALIVLKERKMANFNLSEEIPNLLYEAIAERGRIEERQRIIDAIFDQHGHDASFCFEVSEYKISCEYLQRIMIAIGEWDKPNYA